MKLQITSETNEDYYSLFHVKSEGRNGQILDKDLTIDELANALVQNIYTPRTHEYVSVPSSILSDNLLAYKVSNDGNVADFKAAFILPAEHTGFICLGLPVYVPQPKRLVLYQSTNGHLHVYALKDNDLNTLYWYPLGHVQADGSVCRGSVSTTSSSIEEALIKINDFFIGENSGHYYTEGRTLKEKMSFGQFISSLDRKETFPEDLLVKASFKDFEQAWRNF